MTERVTATSLLVFWAVQFALQAVAALKGMPLALISPFETDVLASLTATRSLPVSMLAVAAGLISALFAWAAVCSVAGAPAPGERPEDVSRLAFAAAILAVTLLCVLSALLGVFVPFQPVAILVGALAISWSVVLGGAGVRTAETDSAARDVRQVAQHMAGEAAYKTMLGAISRRGRDEKAGTA